MIILENINIEAIVTSLVTNIPKVVAAILIFIAFIALYRTIRQPLTSICKRADLEQPVIKLIVEGVLKWVILVFGLLMALKQIGIDVGAALAGLGVAGIAIGFAAQDTLSNIIAGFIIFIDKPFKVHDWIEVDGKYGKVWEITMRSTRIQTLNHTYIVIPNKTIIDTMVNNHSKYGETRIEVHIGIAYKESVEEARTAIVNALKGEQDILEEPAPSVVLKDLGDSSVNLIVRVWTKDAEKEKAVYYNTIETCKNALDAAGIEIPFPHLQLFVDDVTDRAKNQLQQVFTKN